MARDHYVPQCYLKYFSIPGTETLYAYKRGALEPFKAHVSKLAVEKWFNHIKDVPGVAADSVGGGDVGCVCCGKPRFIRCLEIKI